MAEELKGQVGEHIPTVIPLMAQAMGMDVKTLFKTMERGELDPMVALPKLAKLMSEMSAPAMAKYMRSLPYFQGVTQENRQLWGQRFLEAGGTEGLTRFWEVMKRVTEESIPWADSLGDAFGEIAWHFSNFMLLPQELYRWINGETDIRNFWQKYLGDFEAWGNRFDVLYKKIQTLLGGVASLVEKLIDDYVKTVEKTFDWQLDFSDKMRAKRDASKMLEGTGASSEERDALARELEERYKAERRASGETTNQTYFQRLAKAAEERGSGGGPHKEILDFFMGWGDYSESNVLKSEQEEINRQNAFRTAIGLPPIPVPTGSVMDAKGAEKSLVHKGGTKPNSVSHYLDLFTPPQIPNVSGEIRKLEDDLNRPFNFDLIRNIPLNQPAENGTISVTISHTLDVNLNGKVQVEGEVETFVADDTLREKISEGVSQAVSEALPQNANIAR